MIRPLKRRGFTLLELIAAVIIAATLAGIGLQYLRPPSETGKQRSCDLTRQLLQNDADRYTETVGRPPSQSLSELETNQYSGPVLPVCPVTGESYRLGNSGTVECPTHEATR